MYIVRLTLIIVLAIVSNFTFYCCNLGEGHTGFSVQDCKVFPSLNKVIYLFYLFIYCKIGVYNYMYQ